MNQPSTEQQEVINALKTSNVIVDSVAGSGKTTTILHIAKSFDLNILLLTYNKRLKFETRCRVTNFDLKNIEVHSYHSFCVQYYDEMCFNDETMCGLIRIDEHLNKKRGYKIIILDEAQDMSPLYYNLAKKIIRDNNEDIKLCILGDQNQCIFSFNDADNRFLTHADKIFQNNYSWTRTKLSTSFRLTKETADFINNCVLLDNRILTVKSHSKPRYIITDCFKSEQLLAEINMYRQTYKSEDIFVLSPSVHKGIIAMSLSKTLTWNNMPIYVSSGDNEKLNEEVIAKKIVFSTFHQTKGLERKVVIVLNFDDSLFKYYFRDSDCYTCPNEIYVALTRSSERLTVIHHNSNKYLEFINKDELPKYCDIHKVGEYSDVSIKEKRRETAISRITKYLPHDCITKALSYITRSQIRKSGTRIVLEIKTQQGELCESVSDINGIIVPAYYQLATTKQMPIYDHVKSICGKEKFVHLEAFMKNGKLNDNVIWNLLRIGVLYVSSRSGYNFRNRQIKYYNWIKFDQLNAIYDRMSKTISSNAIYEIDITNIDDKNPISGHIDCIDGNNVYEFKTTKDLQSEHFIQLAIYKYALEKLERRQYVDKLEMANTIRINGEQGIIMDLVDDINGKKYYINFDGKEKIMTKKLIVKKMDYQHDKQYFLYNILSDELWKIDCPYAKLKEMIKYIKEVKYGTRKSLTDNEFIEMCNKC